MIIKYIIAFMLLTSPCLAGMGIGGFPYPGPGVVLAESTPQLISLYTSCTDDSYFHLDAATDVYIGGSFLTSDEYTVKGVDVSVYKVGAPSGSITMQLWETSSGTPTTKIADSTTTLSASDITGTFSSRQSKTFNFSDVVLASGTRYAVVAYSPDANGDANYFGIGIGAASCSTNDRLTRSPDATTWTVQNYNRSSYFIIKGE